MPRAILFTLGSLAGLIVLAVGFSVFFGPRLSIDKAERLNKRMVFLRDRAMGSPPDTNALNELVNSLQSRNFFERIAAIGFLGQLGSNAAPATDALVQSLANGDPYAGREAAHSLGEIGPGAKRAVPALLNVLQQHATGDIAWFAAESLGSIADPADPTVIAALKQAAASSDALMRDSAQKGLDRLARRRTDAGTIQH